MTDTISHASTREEEQAARNLLVEHHLFLVPFLAKQWHSPHQRGLDFEDLLQEGYLGLMRAAELYDPQKINPASGQPYRFSSYATWWIRQKIRRALSTQSRAITLPDAIALDLHRLKHIQQDLWGHLQHEPSIEELAREMQCPTAHILLLLDIREVKSLDEAPGGSAFNDDEAASLADLLEAPDALPQQEQQTELSDLLSYLLPRNDGLSWRATNWNSRRATASRIFPFPTSKSPGSCRGHASMSKSLRSGRCARCAIGLNGPRSARDNRACFVLQDIEVTATKGENPTGLQG